MRFTRLKRKPQRLAGTQQVRLPYDIVEMLRPQRFGERRGGIALLEQVILR